MRIPRSALQPFTRTWCSSRRIRRPSVPRPLKCPDNGINSYGQARIVVVALAA
jgi:hypothetical protein